MKLKPEDLDKISQRMKATTILREGAGRVKVTVHMGTCGIASGARDILGAFLKHMDEVDAKDIIITTSGCAGLCSHEPMATVELMDEALMWFYYIKQPRHRMVVFARSMGVRAAVLARQLDVHRNTLAGWHEAGMQRIVAALNQGGAC